MAPGTSRTSRGRVLRRSLGRNLIALAVLLAAVRGGLRAQTPPPSPDPTSAPVPASAPVPSPAAPPPVASPDAPGNGIVFPSSPPTEPPILVDPARAGVVLGTSQTLHVARVLGTVTVVVADPNVADASFDQAARTLTIAGKKIGSTFATLRDERGVTRDVPIRVALAAGTIAPSAFLRVTGRPASVDFLREQALAVALAGVSTQPGATVVANAESIAVAGPLTTDDVGTIDVPIIVNGGNDYFTAQATTRVRVENFAQPPIRPASLLVSDFPETLKENGILFAADLSAKAAERFLYYHYNPPGEPDRRIVLKVQNPSSQPALVQFIAGTAGPGLNEMEVGHLSTERFLARIAQNEGTVVTIPGNATATLMAQGLPAKTTASGLLQLHEIAGAPVHLTLVAQNATDPVDGPIPLAALLIGDRPHARGIYPIPEFFFDYRYDAEGPDLEVPIGQIPLPNLVQGQTLAGDYGVLQSVTIRIVNNDRRHARDIAIYASPRGGRATGTFVIDRVLVRAHAMAAYGHYKLRQYTIAPGSYVRTEIVTMPEGGSSYPLRLVVAPDDGSAAPGTGDSPIY